MAHHNSTPASVLNAPKRTFGFIVEHTSLSRRERRHAIVASSHGGDSNYQTGTPKRVRIPKHRQAPAMNTPYRKPIK